MPKYIATRWNTLCDVLIFVLNNKDKIDKFDKDTIELEQKNYQLLMKKAALKRKKGYQAVDPLPPYLPIVTMIPDLWHELV